MSKKETEETTKTPPPCAEGDEACKDRREQFEKISNDEDKFDKNINWISSKKGGKRSKRRRTTRQRKSRRHRRRTNRGRK